MDNSSPLLFMRSRCMTDPGLCDEQGCFTVVQNDRVPVEISQQRISEPSTPPAKVSRKCLKPTVDLPATEGLDFRSTDEEGEWSDADSDAPLVSVAPTLEPMFNFVCEDKCENLGQEVEEGNVEYKLKLVNPTEERVQHLVTQMNWRLNEGHNEAIYEIGVQDNGHPEGLSDAELEASVRTLQRMAAALSANVQVLRVRQGEAEGKKVAEVLVRKEATADAPLELRVAVVGSGGSGKSTLVGVLTKGRLDNGHGLARMHVFRHRHEIENGQTSSVSEQLMGFTSTGAVANGQANGCELRALTPAEVIAASSKLLTFLDLAGEEKYFKTTVRCLTGRMPDYAMVTVDAAAGVDRMTREHFGLTLALRVPIFVVLTKTDTVDAQQLAAAVADVAQLLAGPGAGRQPLPVASSDDVMSAASGFSSGKLVPLFAVSGVDGTSLDLLLMFLNLLPAKKERAGARLEPTEFYIDDVWGVPGVGTVVSGAMARGVCSPGSQLLLGPDEHGAFIPVTVKSIHTKRIAIKKVCAGQTAAFSIKASRINNEGEDTCHATTGASSTSGSGGVGCGAVVEEPLHRLRRSAIRKGMVLVDPKLKPTAVRDFEAELSVLHCPTAVMEGQQLVVHARTARQTAVVVSIVGQARLVTGERAVVRFRFMFHPEFICIGDTIVVSSGGTKGVGTVRSIAL